MSASTSPIISDALYSAANKWSPGSISPVTNGKRTISGELLSPSDSGYGSGSSSANTGASTPPPLVVPSKLESTDTMTWIGFDSATGDRIVNEYLTDVEAQPLQRHIENHIRYSEIKGNCNNTKSGNWVVAMRQLGISNKMQQSIMDPEFEFPRSWHPLRHWLEQFIVDNFLSLVALEDRVRVNIRQAQSGIPQLRGGDGDEDRADYLYKKPGYTTLYRATTAGRIKDVFQGGEVKLGAAMCRPDMASDFGYEAFGSFSYWTPDEWVAQLYGKFCERNINNIYDICVLKLVARAHHVELPGETWRLTYGDDWRKLVWHSRTQTDYPKEILEKHKKTSVFIGPLSVDATATFKGMSSWTNVTSANVCKKFGSGEEAVQYAFHTPPVMNALAAKATVDLFRFQNKKVLADPKTWVAGR